MESCLKAYVNTKYVIITCIYEVHHKITLNWTCSLLQCQLLRVKYEVNRRGKVTCSGALWPGGGRKTSASSGMSMAEPSWRRYSLVRPARAPGQATPRSSSIRRAAGPFRSTAMAGIGDGSGQGLPRRPLSLTLLLRWEAVCV
jgi:hypothetical protein